jgi:8-oxo-dGTP diphosphatase
MTRPEYVLGFRFWNGRVALIRKLRPSWMGGRLNGIGGKVEAQDLCIDFMSAAHAAMVREFREETGLETYPHEWRKFGVLTHDGARIHLFTGSGPGELQQTTDEGVAWYRPDTLYGPFMKNLLWLIPMAMDPDKVYAEIIDNTPVPKEA